MAFLGALIPLFQHEEREQGRRDAEDGLDSAPPILGWGGYQDGYDEVAEENDQDWNDE